MEENRIKLKDDLLDRGNYALGLCRIIGKYSAIADMETPTENNALIMSISAQWGFGKTKFIHLLKDVLTKDDSIVSDPKGLFTEFDKLNEDEIVIFDAWINDFYEDPMIPFSRMLIENICGKGTSECDSAIANFKSYMELLRNHGSLPETETDDKYKPNIDNLSLDTQLSKIQKNLQECIQKKSQKKVVIIVDELDRCKPTFAVKTLEIVKHLFNIKGLVYIFALDITELQHCVKTVYGNEFNAIGYLQRFFDYSTWMPEVQQETLFEDIAKKFKIVETENDQIKDPDLVSVFYDICNDFHLSAREMRAICFSFRFLQEYGLKDYPRQAKMLYFYIMVMKHKKPLEWINLLYQSNASSDLLDKYPPRFKPNEQLPKENPFFTIAKANIVIQIYPEFRLVYEDGRLEESTKYLFYNDNTKSTSFAGIALEKILDNNLIKVDRNTSEGIPYNLTNEESLSYALYRQDIEDIQNNNIHTNMRLLEYLDRKVEQYGVSMAMLTQTNNLIESPKPSMIQQENIVYFGSYWQDANGNEKSPIEWLVLDKEKDGTLLLISRYVLNCKPYNEKFTDVTWETCTLRKWLNSEFLKNAFTEEEKVKILLTELKNEDNPEYGTEGGNNTKDMIFLLSIQEARRYFSIDVARQCKPTDYATKKTIYVSAENGAYVWWLRSPGSNSYGAASVDYDGDFFARGDNVGDDNVGVRPACRVNLES